jgi:hypothetical protein
VPGSASTAIPAVDDDDNNDVDDVAAHAQSASCVAESAAASVIGDGAGFIPELKSLMYGDDSGEAAVGLSAAPDAGGVAML